MKGTPLSDREILALCSGPRPMIAPFVPARRKPSYGLSSFGYDIRLGSRFLVPPGRGQRGSRPGQLSPGPLPGGGGRADVRPRPHSQVLAESVEVFDMPEDVVGLAVGKSSYARCGLLCNLTPLEPRWRGRLTLELANLSPLPIRLHVGQGIAQVVFFRGERPARAYDEKESGGTYQDQKGVTLPQ